MELSGLVLDLLQRQVTHERANAALYLQASLNCEAAALFGFSKMFREQSKEEEGHRDKMARYIIDKNENVELDVVPIPGLLGSETVIELLEASLRREMETTANISNIYWTAFNANDAMTAEFMHWFLHEQIEEERKFVDMIARVKAIGLGLVEFELNK